MEEIERSAASVEEALEAALDELGVSEQEAQVEIVQEPKSGFLGLRGHEAIVRVRLKSRADQQEEPAEDIEDQVDAAAEFLEGLLDRMGTDAEVEQNLVDGTMYVEIVGEEDDEMALLIGRHGATLDALQGLVRVVVGRQLGTRCRVMVDVEDYRKRRRARIAAKATDLAKRVRSTGREEALEPMNSYERKIVHDAVGSIGGVESESRGEEPDRRVVIRKSR